MNIAIDARFYGKGHTGLGRYTTNVLKYLPNHLSSDKLFVLLRDSEYDNFPSFKNVTKVHAEIPHYSLAEQLKLPKILKNIKADLLYTLHFNAPILSKIPKIVTVHDLIKSHFTGLDTTTRSRWLYALKRLGYNKVLSKTLSSSSAIIVPTNAVKSDILSLFPLISSSRIYPISEAPDEIFRSPNIPATTSDLPSKYILFVGNAYPHKNLDILLRAARNLKDLHLVIVAKRTPFLTKVLSPYDPSRIHVLSDLDDTQLVSLYKNASVLVTPSLMEGYGLVGLEALMLGTPVVASNIEVYREVYGDSVLYFEPQNENHLVSKIKKAVAVGRRKQLKFDRTWDEVASDIAEVIHARSASI